LFAAQQQQLNQLLPTITAPANAQAIGSGNFGSLRGQTAADTAEANALAQLQSAQMQAALQNQATGVQAGSAAGNVAQQNINNLLTTGQYQQASPYINAANLGNILAGVQPGATVSNTTNLSPLNQVMGLATALGGSSTSGLLGTLFGTQGNNQPQYLSNGQPNPAYQATTQGILNSLSNLFSGSSNTPTPGVGQMVDPTTGAIVPDPTYGSGQTASGVDLSTAGVSNTQQQYGV
jgi:hypothetical protein